MNTRDELEREGPSSRAFGGNREAEPHTFHGGGGGTSFYRDGISPVTNALATC